MNQIIFNSSILRSSMTLKHANLCSSHSLFSPVRGFACRRKQFKMVYRSVFRLPPSRFTSGMSLGGETASIKRLTDVTSTHASITDMEKTGESDLDNTNMEVKDNRLREEMLKPNDDDVAGIVTNVNTVDSMTASKPKSARNISEGVKAKFMKCMQNKDVPLLRDVDTYCQSLPVREMVMAPAARLYQLPFYVRENDLEILSKSIDDSQVGSSRLLVNYLSAPPGSGKSACVLPAFLKSRNATHYLYLAFNNNDGRHFSVFDLTASASKKMAELQGAAFMVQCVKMLLEGEKPTTIPLCTTPTHSDVGGYVDELQGYLDGKLGKEAVIWFHVDEHRKMCDIEAHPKVGVDFCRGALSMLAQIRNVKVIASYVEPVTALGPVVSGASAGPVVSSDICRRPLAVPPMDIEQVMDNVNELHINKTIVQSDETFRGLYGSLKVRLGLKLIRLGPGYVLHRKDANAREGVFLREFHRYATQFNAPASTYEERKGALVECNRLCTVEIGRLLGNDYASKLLLGGFDDEEWLSEKRHPNIVVLPPLCGSENSKLTASIVQLLGMKQPISDSAFEPDHPYNKGRDLFLDFVSNADLLSSRPLEAAYYWAIGTRSAEEKQLTFQIRSQKLSFPIECKQLMPNRIFDGQDPRKFKLTFLKNKAAKTTIFFANKKTQAKPMTHPLADLFFLSDNRLVLIDITGVGDGDEKGKDIVSGKVRKLENWFATHKSEISRQLGRSIKPYGIVLAPNARKLKGEFNEKSGTMLLTGDDALNLLGGLRQLHRWMDN